MILVTHETGSPGVRSFDPRPLYNMDGFIPIKPERRFTGYLKLANVNILAYTASYKYYMLDEVRLHIYM